MKLIGKTVQGGTVVEVPADTKRVARYTFPYPARVPKLSAFLDGLGSGTGNQLVRGVIYDSAGNLVALGDEVSILDGATGAWVDLPISDVGGSVISAGDYDLGILAGPADRTVRIYGDDPGSGSLTGTSPLTVSTNEITDAIRALAVQGDGRGYTPVTNLATNGGFETNTTGHSASAGNTITRVLASVENIPAKFGLAMGKGVFGGANGSTTDAFSLTLPVAGIYTASAWVWVPSDYDGAGLTFQQSNFTGATASTSMNVDMAKRDQWQLVVASVTVVSTDLTGDFRFVVVGVPTAGKAIYTDGWMIEMGPVAHSYVHTDGAIATQVQGAPDGSVGVWEGTTNLHKNGGAETGTSFTTSAGAGTTLSRDTSRSKFGSASFRLICSGAGGSQGIIFWGDAGPGTNRITVSPSTAYSASVWCVDDGTGATLYFRIDWYDATNTLISVSSATNLVPTTTFARYTHTAISPPNAAFALIRLNTLAATATTFWADGFQFETHTAAPSFGLSGNEVTDATRAAVLTTASSGQMMDGLLADSSMGVHRAATNLFRRGQCDSTTDYANTGGTVTRTIDTGVVPPFSTQSIACATAGGVAGEGVEPITNTGLAMATGVLAAGSIYFKGVSGAQYGCRMKIVNTDASITSGTQLVFNATGNWQLLTPATVAVAAGKTGDRIDIQVITTTQRAETFWVAHPMLEQITAAVAVVAPYVATSGGATATRGASLVSAPVSLISTTQGWVAARIRMGWASTSGKAVTAIEIDDGTGNNRIALVFNAVWATRRISGGVSGASASKGDTFAAGDFKTVILKWDATTISVSIDGTAFQTASAGQTFNPTAFAIGGNPVGGWFDSDYFWVATGTGTLTDANAATIHAFGNADPASTSVFPSSAITALWKGVDAKYQTPITEISVVTPYVETNGAQVTRASGRVQAPSLLLNSQQGWIAFRMRAGFASSLTNSGVTSGRNFFAWGDNGNSRMYGYYPNGNGVAAFDLGFTPNGTNFYEIRSNQDLAVDDYVTVVLAWSVAAGSTTLRISVNGAAFTSSVLPAAIPAFTGSLFEIGGQFGGGGAWDGDMMWVTGGTGVPVDADAATLHANGNTDPVFASVPASPSFVWAASDMNYVYTKSGQWNIDSYSDGASAVFGASTPLDMDMSIFATYVNLWTPNVTNDDYAARLPYLEAQDALDTGGEDLVLHGTLGWHGTSVDADRGSFCLAKLGTAFEDLVGKRLRITTGDRSVVAFCHDTEEEGTIYDDLSVSRRLYTELSVLGEHPISVRVAVVSE